MKKVYENLELEEMGKEDKGKKESRERGNEKAVLGSGPLPSGGPYSRKSPQLGSEVLGAVVLTRVT